MSSGPWKKHKYFQKIGEGANAVYRYKITGKGYKEEARKEESRREDAQNKRDFYTDSAKYDKEQSDKYANSSKELRKAAALNKYYNKDMSEKFSDASSTHKMLSNSYKRTAAEEARKAERYSKAESDYAKARDKAESDYKTKSIAGKAESTANRAKELLDKKKKKWLKHGDLHSTVERGEMILAEMLGSSEELEHSSGPWKKHKYVLKTGEGKDAKYTYANTKVGATYNKYRSMPGVDPAKAAKWTAEDVIDDAKFEAEYALSNGAYKAGRYLSEKSGYQARQDMLEAQRKHRSANNGRNDSYFKDAKTEGEKSWNKIVDQDVKNKRDTAHAAEQVYDKTALGKAEKTVSRAKEILDKKKKKRNK